jgi:hypothetical protein
MKGNDMNLNFHRWAMQDFANQVGALSAEGLALWCAIPRDAQPSAGAQSEARWEGEGGGLTTAADDVKGQIRG